MTDPRRHLPAVDALLDDPAFTGPLSEHPRVRIVATLRALLDEARSAPASLPEDPESLADPARWATSVRDRLEEEAQPSLRRVLNATGVVLHTNLGRAPLARAAREAFLQASAGYTNLEFDLDAGERGSRYDHGAGLLAELTGAEAGLVVNNCAAGLLLALNTLARGRGTVVSRGELVEIGGGFRIPEILERAGTRLVEVGSTNRTRLEDYRGPVEGGAEGEVGEEDRPDVAVILKVHRSNFRLGGFTEEAGLRELAQLAEAWDRPLVHDLGSGLLADPETLGLPPEPRPAESIASGADLVIFSGDKLLGGPQAGLVVGRAELVARMRSNPLCRALRVDKATLAALEATLRLYRDPEAARREIPVLAVLSTPQEELEGRARALMERLEGAGLEGVRVEPGEGAVGGGTYPEVTLPSWTLRVEPERTFDASAERVARRLRTGTPSVVARIEAGEVVFDLRTLLPGEDEELLERILHLATPDPR